MSLALDATPSARLIAIGLMAGAVACFAVLDTLAKSLVVSGVPTEQVVFARYATNLALLLVFLNPWTQPGLFRSKRPLLQVIRALTLVGSTACNFFALRYLQLADTTAIMFATPFITAILAGVAFGQWLGRIRWVVIGMGFLGVLVVTRPGLTGFHPAMLISMCAVVCYAVYNLLTRVLAADDPPTTTLALGALWGTVATLPTAALPGLDTVPTTPGPLLMMVGMGALGLVGHWFLIKAHQRAPAQVLAPYMYSQIVWMVILGWLVFADVPSVYTLIGAGIVIASGLWLLMLDRGEAKR